MKINFYYWLFSALLIFTGLVSYGQQTYSNQEWVRQTPAVGDNIYHTSTIVVSGKLYVTGNILNGSGNTDIYTLKIDSNGDTLWSSTYSGSATGSMDYGIELQASSDGYIYVIGAAQNSSTGYDYCLLKYNASTGSQTWVRNWNGAGNGDDIPTALKVDGSSAIYITGGSEASNGFSDYGTIKVSNLNVLNWAKYYNYNGLHDGGTTITTSLGDVIVSGGSAAAVGDWDIATIRYNKLSGSSGTPYRTNITGATMVEASAMTTDSLNNIYITGYAEISGDKNMQTIKLDSLLSLQWIADLGSNNMLDEVGKDVGVDGNGNVYITGYSENLNGGNNFRTIKYDVNGNLVWNRYLENTGVFDDGRAEKLAVTGDGLFITGTIEKNGIGSMCLLKYNEDGKITFLNEFRSDTVDYSALEIAVDGIDVYITGLSQTVNQSVLTNIKFSLETKFIDPVYVGEEPSFNANELIIRFDTSAIIKESIDNKNFTFGTLRDFVDPSLISDMEEKTGFEMEDLRTYKIFIRMTTADSISITRLGDSHRLPDFWAVLSVMLPENVDEQEIADSLNTMYPKIHYAHVNGIIKLQNIPNDELISTEQESLLGTGTYPDGHINIDTAWDISVGEQHTKVGVFDEPIFWAHEDFGDGTFAGSKITGGWDFQNNLPITATTNPGNSHGTAVGGIIGALRNNDLGISGIAGGDVDSDANNGCQLFSFALFDDGAFATMANASNAIVEGAAYVPGTGFGYGLNIQNHSWGGGVFYMILAEAVNSCYEDQCTFVASRGNDGGEDINFPAVFPDNWVISVGASGFDGRYKNINNGDPWWESSFGLGVDFIAPGTTEIVSSTINPDSPFNWDTCSVTTAGYECFNGSSSAAPHVSGVTALMQSHHHISNGCMNNLAPEDCENILQISALDIDGTFDGFVYANGYDDLSGWGLIDAGAAVGLVNFPAYEVKHFISNTAPTLDTTFGIYVNVSSNIYGVPAGNYYADRYEATWTYVHTFNASEEVIGVWPRISSSRGVSAANPIGGLTWVETNEVISGNQVTVTVTTYCWFIDYNIIAQPVHKWIPCGPSQLYGSYSVHVKDNYYLEVDEEMSQSELSIYPNPTNGLVNIQYSTSSVTNTTIEVIDMTGKIVYMANQGLLSAGQQNLDLDLSILDNGIYTIRILAGDVVMTKLFVKTE